MILINLLPDEYKQKQRTPIKYMAGIAAVVAINATLFAYWGWTSFGVAAEVKSELIVLMDTNEGLQGQVSYHKDLEKESGIYRSREDMLAKVTSSRVSWTQQVDRMVDLINKGGEGEKYLVWLDDLNVDQKENTRSKTYGVMKGKGHSGSASFAHVANFLEDIEESELMFEFMPPGKPEGTQSTKDEGLMPAEVISFPLELDLRSPDERSKMKKTATSSEEKKSK